MVQSIVFSHVQLSYHTCCFDSALSTQTLVLSGGMGGNILCKLMTAQDKNYCPPTETAKLLHALNLKAKMRKKCIPQRLTK